MKSSMLIYSPAIVVLLWAAYIEYLGRTDEAQVLWLLLFAISLWLHAREERHV
jgi:positive regulator of sigma E activity